MVSGTALQRPVIEKTVTDTHPIEPHSGTTTIWDGAHLATMAPGTHGTDGYGIVQDGAVVVRGDRIAWVGPRNKLPADFASGSERRQFAAPWVTPGLVDCHTHLVYAGDRAREFEMRLEGASYEEISRAGGGIVSTVRATREADEDTLYQLARSRLAPMLACGTTTVEIKSGYGLDVPTEARMLRVARRLGASLPVGVATTHLGAHALPPEFAGRPDDFIDMICTESLPTAAAEGLVDAVDAFCEGIGFTRAQTARVFDAAAALGLPVKLHAEQLSDLGGAELAAERGALSADHLEYLSEAGIRAMAASGTVAVLLPGAFYFLRETRLPPVAALRAAGVPIAIATDSNPGSSPVASPLLMLNMACTQFGMTPAEALAGMTRIGATALGMGHEVGALIPGLRADMVAWQVDSPAELAYHIGHNPAVQVIQAGTDTGLARPMPR